tara:strand:- start:38 stop:595 length:558 start_codon:yes stop_codon:yes gene_type:complete
MMTNSNYQLNIKSIQCFHQISDSLLNSIEKESKLVKYKIGDSITQGDIIPNKILLILSGEVRLTTNASTNTETIAILKAGSFIGLASFLRAVPCESTSAMNDLLILSIPDTLILNIYQTDLHFKNWCDKTIQPIEVYELLKALFKNKKNQEYKSLINQLMKLLSVEAINNGEIIKQKKDIVKLID